MGTFDLPLSELKTYMGITPRPADFDQFWERSLAEMRAVKPNVKIEKAEYKVPFADCFDMSFDSTKGSRIHAKLMMPKSPVKPAPAVLKFHGYGGNAGEWTEGFGFAAAGYVYAAMDCRGQRGSSTDMGSVIGETYKGLFMRGIDDKPENMTMRNTFLDTAKLAEVVMDMDIVDKNRICVFGLSQGGALAAVCAALVTEVKRASIMFPFLSDYKRVWELDLAKDAYEELKSYFRFYDPKHEREEEVFTKLGYIDIQNFAKWIKADVLFLTGLMDTVCPPSTQFAAYNKITSNKKMNIYPDFTHEAITNSNDEVFEFMMGS